MATIVIFFHNTRPSFFFSLSFPSVSPDSVAQDFFHVSQYPLSKEFYRWRTMGQSNQECKETSESNVWVM